MGFNSMDDFINKVTSPTTSNSGFGRTDWNKNVLPTTTQAAGEWYYLGLGAGNPPTMTAMTSGSTIRNREFHILNDDQLNNCGIQHYGNVVSGTKHVINASAYSAAATGQPAILMLVDVLGFYPIMNATLAIDQDLINTKTLSRYTDGAGVQAIIVPSVVMGAATPTIQLTYTNSDGVAGRITPAQLPIGKTASPVGHISYSGVAGTGKYGPFVPLMSGDKGIRSVQKYKLSVSYVSGVENVILVKPLFTLPITTLGVAAERDFMNQLPSLPEIKNGACLQWIMYAGANTPVASAYYGHLDFAWG